MQLVTCAFPGTGKSTISKNAEQYGLKHCHVHFNDHTREYELTIPAGPGVPVFDSDSSVFDKSEFPGNYIKHIKDVLATCPEVVIFVSSHDNVRAALKEAGIEYQLAYPERQLKGDYIERYKQRGSSEFFVNLMDTKWNDFIDSCESDDGAKRHIILSEGEFLVDQLKDVLGQPLDIIPGDTVIEQPSTTLVDPVFPTAIISGNESIGDVVCDDVGRPVAAWGANGLEPLPAQTPDTSVVVTTDAFGLEVAPEAPPAVADPVVEGADVVATPDFSTAIVTGTESIGDIVYNDIGEEVAVVGESGLQPLPETAPGDIAPAEALPANVIAEVQAVPETPVPAVTDGPAGDVPSVLNLPEEMQVPTNIEIPQLDIVADNDEPQVALNPESGDVVVTTDVGVTVEVDPGAGTTEIKQGEDTVIVDNNVTTVAGNESSEENPTDLPVPADNLPPAMKELDKADLIENYFELDDDITVLQSVVEVCQTDARDGLEGYEDGGIVFQQAVEHLKTRYGKEVEPTLAGLEGFLDAIKNAFTAIGEKIKGQPNKEQLAKVKKYLFEAEKAFLTYGTDKWINSQKLINVGKVKLQVPVILKDVNSASDVDSILKLINERVLKAFKNHDSNAAARLRAGMKVFNQFKKKPEDTDIAELGKELPISPEKISTGGAADAGINNLDTKFVAGEFPVLNAAGIKEISKVVEGIIDVSFHMLKSMEGYEDKTLVDSDFWDSDFFDKHSESDSVDAVMACTIYDRVTDQLQDIDYMYGQKLLNVCKFLEMWILQSTK